MKKINIKIDVKIDLEKVIWALAILLLALL